MEFRLIGVPVFEGCNIRGVEKAPKVLRESGVFDILKSKFTVIDEGDIELLPSLEEDMLKVNGDIKYADILLDMGKKLCSKVQNAINEGVFPITVGGDHSVGVGSLAGSSIANNHNIGVVWIDAHADMNTDKTSPSKNYHGMPLASSLYVGDEKFRAIGIDKPKVKAANTFLLAARSIDEGEIKLRDEIGVNHYTMDSIHEKGMTYIANEIVTKLRDAGIDKLHVSFDLDSLSTNETTAFNCPVDNGLTLVELKEFLANIFASGIVCSLDITEYNPDNDSDGSGVNAIKELVKTITESIS